MTQPLRWLPLALAVACGGGTTSGPDPVTGPEDTPAGAPAPSPYWLAAPPAKLPARRPVADWSRYLNPISVGAPPGSMGDVREQYRTVAPATVLIRAGNGMGSGVLVDPSGLIVTNNHVVETAEVVDFRMQVTVEFGRPGDGNAMVPDGTRRPADVLRLDPAHDLALLRVAEVPEYARAVTVAADDPVPGEPIACLGQGTVGLVWAIKSGEISAVGRLTQLANDVAFDTTSLADQIRVEGGVRAEGMVIQTTCGISPGDSGGPLVNADSELIGINQFGVPIRGRFSNFHVHVTEVRPLLRDVPSEPYTRLPDPWDASGATSGATQGFADADLDGRVETVVLDVEGVRRALFDLDQNTVPSATARPPAELMLMHGFDPEYALVTTADALYAWYDRDDDGRFDVLLQHAGGTVTGYLVAASSGPRRADDLAGSGFDRPDLLPDGAARRMFLRMIEGLGSADDLPGPLPGMLGAGTLLDADEDGTPDTVRGASLLGQQAAIVDLDQDTLAGATDADIAARLAGHRIDVELSVIVDERLDLVWAYYDRDGDGRLETLLRGDRTGIAHAAWEIAEDGSRTELPAYVGGFVIRPELCGGDPARRAAILAGVIPAEWMPAEGAVNGMPDPTVAAGERYVEPVEGIQAFQNAVVRVQAFPGPVSAILVDVDRSSFRGRNAQHLQGGLAAAVEDGHFHPDFAFVVRGETTWTWYDGDLDGTWDRVLVRTDGVSGPVTTMQVRGADGSFTPEPVPEDARLVRWSAFRSRAVQRTFQRVAAQLFQEWMLEPRP